MNKYNYVIFHKGCLDGFSGYFVAHNTGKIDKNATVWQDVPSATRVPKGIEGKDVLIIDVAYKKEVLEEIFRLASSVVFIDHHVSIKEDVEELYEKYKDKTNIKIKYDERHSGATLTWKFFHKREQAPLFLKYIEDQDTGKWEYENTKPFIYALHANYHLSIESKSLNKWARLLNKQYVLEMIEQGKYMQMYNEHLVNINLPRHSLHSFPSKDVLDHLDGALDMEIGQYTVAVYNGFNCPSVTDLAKEALKRMENVDFCLFWIYNIPREMYIVSLRSRDTDITPITKAFGGGGHTYAGAFSFSKTDIDISDLFHKTLRRTFNDTQSDNK
jgi:nanoRNase/pAp phosphatase (c-di-AMP/oligoRNAs hydrolase)